MMDAITLAYLIRPLNVTNIIQTSLDFCFRSIISRSSLPFSLFSSFKTTNRDPFLQSDRLIAVSSILRIFHQSFLINKQQYLRDVPSTQCSFLLVPCLVTGGIAAHFVGSEENTREERSTARSRR